MQSWTKARIGYWLEQIFIVLAHLFLLYWIYYCLSSGGALSTEMMLMHFVGLALFGASLIRGTAYLVQKRYLKENNLTIDNLRK